jgi:hypothetical protein
VLNDGLAPHRGHENKRDQALTSAAGLPRSRGRLEPPWLLPAAVALAGGALVGFVLSRVIRVFGFVERGWEPAP